MDFLETFKNKNRPDFILLWLGWMIGNFADVVVGLIGIMTFCIYRPNWDMEIRFWWSRFIIRKWKLKTWRRKNLITV